MPRYSIIELSDIPKRLNNNGQIAGWIFVGTDADAAIYSNGAWRDLGVAGAQLSALFGINDAGAAVGYSFAAFPGPDNRWQAIWSPAGAPAVEALSALPPDSFSYAINDSSVIVGCLNRYDDIYPDPNRAYAYLNGSVTDLHSLLSPLATQSPFDFSCARDVNATGDVVGEVQLASGPQRGFVYRNGVMNQLEQGMSYLVNANAINDSGRSSVRERWPVFSQITPSSTTSRPERSGASVSRRRALSTAGRATSKAAVMWSG